MWLCLRHGMMQYTRLFMEDMGSHEEYQAQLYDGHAALVAAATIEYFHTTSDIPDALEQFKFTWKLHVSCAHMHEQIFDVGHPIQASDMWVEQLMRTGATKVVKCAPMSLGVRPTR